MIGSGWTWSTGSAVCIFGITVGSQTASNAAWFSPQREEKATEIEDHVAVYGVVEVG